MPKGTYNKNTTTAEYGNNNAEVGKLQTYLNSQGANLAVDSKYGDLTKDAVAKYGTPTNPIASVTPGPVPPPTTITTPTPAGDLSPAPKITLPTPNAGTTYDNYTTALTTNTDNIRKTVEDTYKTQLEDITAQKKILAEDQAKMLEGINPENRSTYVQENRIKQNELDAAEAASSTIKEDFAKRRSLTNELQTLLTQGNTLIAQQKNLPLSMGVINKKVAGSMTDISARAGVLEATFSALDGNITQAYNIINQAKDTVSAQWNDNLEYYKTLLTLNDNNTVKLDAEEKKIAEKQVKLIENDLAKVDTSVNYIQKLMIDPESAQFIAEAGIKLTDSVQEINQKMSTQSKVVEIKTAKNDMAKKGYVYVPFPSSTSGLVAMSVGGQNLYFKEPVSKTAKAATTKPITAAALKTTFADFLKTGIAPSGEKFGNPMGNDGYVDPTVYNTAFEQWTGTTKEFLLNYPIKQYVNPASYTKLPASLQETLKTKESASASGLSDEDFLKLLDQPTK